MICLKFAASGGEVVLVILLGPIIGNYTGVLSKISAGCAWIPVLLADGQIDQPLAALASGRGMGVMLVGRGSSEGVILASN